MPTPDFEALDYHKRMTTRLWLGKLLDDYNREVACVTYNGWHRHRDPYDIRKELDELLDKILDIEF